MLATKKYGLNRLKMNDTLLTKYLLVIFRSVRKRRNNNKLSH